MTTEEEEGISLGEDIFNVLTAVTRKVDNDIEVGVTYVGYANGQFLEARIR